MTVDEYEFRTKLIALEIETCKQLASNDVKTRKQGLRRLRALLSGDRTKGIEIEDFNRIWTGLFTYVWMSDTPLVQEADVDEVSNLVHRIEVFEGAMLFVRGFFATITNHWNRISHHRIDKFLMFIRRFLRQILFLLKNSNWDSEKVVKFSSELYSAIQVLPYELIQHLCDVYNEELAKVSEGNISTDTLILLLKCFVDCITHQKPSKAVVNHINTNIFCSLVGQLKLLIKQKAAVEFDPEAFSFDKAEEGQSASNLDPRPGNAHVFLPYIDFDENKMVVFLEEILSSAEIGQKAKNIISQDILMFKSVARLRESMNQSTNILREVNEKEDERKKKPKKFSSVVKKACKRLEANELPTKKMKKLLCRNQWEISKNVDSNPKVVSAQEWTVTKLKKNPISFCEKTDVISYEAESDTKSETSPVTIMVPRSTCHQRPGILCTNQNYMIVDFENSSNDLESAKTDTFSVVESSNENMPLEPAWVTSRFDMSDSSKINECNEVEEEEFSGKRRTSTSVKTDRTEQKVKQSKRRKTEIVENPEKEKIQTRKSVVSSLSNYEPRRTRSGRVFSTNS